MSVRKMKTIHWVSKEKKRMDANKGIDSNIESKNLVEGKQGDCFSTGEEPENDAREMEWNDGEVRFCFSSF